MKGFLVAALISSFAIGPAAMAYGAEQNATSDTVRATCENKAVGKNGKTLAGAAKASFMKKCLADTCAATAVSKDGKPLFGAAKNSFVQKCERAS